MMLPDNKELTPLAPSNNVPNPSCFRIIKFWLCEHTVGDQFCTGNRFTYVLYKVLSVIGGFIALIAFGALVGFNPINYLIGLFVEWLFIKQTTMDYNYWMNCVFGFTTLSVIMGCIAVALTLYLATQAIKQCVDNCKKEYRENQGDISSV